jgi:hypothetical protein
VKPHLLEQRRDERYLCEFSLHHRNCRKQRCRSFGDNERFSNNKQKDHRLMAMANEAAAVESPSGPQVFENYSEEIAAHVSIRYRILLLFHPLPPSLPPSTVLLSLKKKKLTVKRCHTKYKH